MSISQNKIHNKEKTIFSPHLKTSIILIRIKLLSCNFNSSQQILITKTKVNIIKTKWVIKTKIINNFPTQMIPN